MNPVRCSCGAYLRFFGIQYHEERGTWLRWDVCDRDNVFLIAGEINGQIFQGEASMLAGNGTPVKFDKDWFNSAILPPVRLLAGEYLGAA